VLPLFLQLLVLSQAARLLLKAQQVQPPLLVLVLQLATVLFASSMRLGSRSCCWGQALLLHVLIPALCQCHSSSSSSSSSSNLLQHSSQVLLLLQLTAVRLQPSSSRLW
jgi:hypothetical protein